MQTDNLRNLINLVEAKGKQDLVIEKLPYSRGALAPVMSQATVDYHYGELAKGYVERYNKGEGDPSFNEAGAFLHNIFFPQLRPPKNNNQPHGASLALINRKFGSFKDLKEDMKKEAMKIQGSGWVYLSTGGEIKTIANHAVRTDICVLIDWWEHVWATDYQWDKEKYLNNIWRIINWDVCSERL